ncbi:dimethylsulfonioproprionate lyase family protein [Paenibacillus sp. QZ-Y1]|uniref:dimethylsulfonioproprionate lyase family protein n=1 Tax=Paenibacillus sp. QZ-Y1 TaxID=3414511 RepID=UPI003F7ADE43
MLMFVRIMIFFHFDCIVYTGNNSFFGQENGNSKRMFPGSVASFVLIRVASSRSFFAKFLGIKQEENSDFTFVYWRLNNTMEEINRLIDTFLIQLHRRLEHYETNDSDILDEISQVLQVWPVVPSSGKLPSPQGSPVAKYLDIALTLGDTGAESSLAAAIRPLAPFLHWAFGYPPHPLHPNLESHVSFAQIIGPEDLGRADHLLMGLTLLAPETLYPAHVHPANEIYIPIGGTGVWTKGSEQPTPRAPGSFILHQSGMVHTTESKLDPVLALYIWRGDLITSSKFLINPEKSSG